MSKLKKSDISNIFNKLSLESHQIDDLWKVSNIFEKYGLTTQQIIDLIQLTIQEGDDKTPLFSLDSSGDKYFVLEITARLKREGFEYVYEYLQWAISQVADDGNTDYLKKKFIMMEDLLEEKSSLKFELINFLYPPKISEGAVDCRRCGSKRTISRSKQTRSGDEPTTIKAICMDCNLSWVV